jgi:hypothetical protein
LRLPLLIVNYFLIATSNPELYSDVIPLEKLPKLSLDLVPEEEDISINVFYKRMEGKLVALDDS